MADKLRKQIRNRHLIC